jgi:hypothetical protein
MHPNAANFLKKFPLSDPELNALLGASESNLQKMLDAPCENTLHMFKIVEKYPFALPILTRIIREPSHAQHAYATKHFKKT